LKLSDEWGEVLESGGHFALQGEPQPSSYRHEVRYESVEGVVDLCRTYSYVRNALSDEELAVFEGELRDMLRSFHGDEPFSMVYQTKLYVLRPTA